MGFDPEFFTFKDKFTVDTLNTLPSDCLFVLINTEIDNLLSKLVVDSSSSFVVTCPLLFKNISYIYTLNYNTDFVWKNDILEIIIRLNENSGLKSSGDCLKSTFDIKSVNVVWLENRIFEILTRIYNEKKEKKKFTSITSVFDVNKHVLKIPLILDGWFDKNTAKISTKCLYYNMLKDFAREFGVDYSFLCDKFKFVSTTNSFDSKIYNYYNERSFFLSMSSFDINQDILSIRAFEISPLEGSSKCIFFKFDEIKNSQREITAIIIKILTRLYYQIEKDSISITIKDWVGFYEIESAENKNCKQNNNNNNNYKHKPLPPSESSESKESKESNICKICMENEQNMIAIKCGHLYICETCVGNKTNNNICAICSQSVEYFQKVYKT